MIECFYHIFIVGSIKVSISVIHWSGMNFFQHLADKMVDFNDERIQSSLNRKFCLNGEGTFTMKFAFAEILFAFSHFKRRRANIFKYYFL